MYVYRLRDLLHEANPEDDQYDTTEMLDLEGIQNFLLFSLGLFII